MAFWSSHAMWKCWHQLSTRSTLTKILAQQMRENNKNDIKQYDISFKSDEYIKLFEKVMVGIERLSRKIRSRKIRSV